MGKLRSKPRESSVTQWLSNLSKIFISLLCVSIGVQAAPCPVETAFYGGAMLDGSPDEYEQYFVVDDDDLTRVTSFSYCVCCINPDSGEHEHFRGFSTTIYSPTTGY